MGRRENLKALAVLAALYALGAAFQHAFNPYLQDVARSFAINAVLALGLNLIIGFTGLFSLGHAGFLAIGAYVTAALLDWGAGAGYPAAVLFPVAAVAAAASCAVAGVAIGVPTLRLRGDYLAMATLGFAEIVRVVIMNFDAVGGARGFSTPFAMTAKDVGAGFVVAGLTYFLLKNLTESSRGKAFLAIREDETAAASVGIAVTKFKVAAFGVGAAFAGVAGFMTATYKVYLHPDSFGFVRSFEVIVMVILGGMGSLVGSVVAALVLTITPEILRVVGFPEERMIIYAVLLVVLMLVRPQGLLGKKVTKGAA
jgi:branched-chain amino acid transport system permease protein